MWHFHHTMASLHVLVGKDLENDGKEQNIPSEMQERERERKMESH